MLPNPDRFPPGVGQPEGDGGVALTVGSQLCEPPGLVGLRYGAVEWAAVPEAPVDKDRDPSTREDDVSARPKSRDRGKIDPVPEA
jgi:hypothetical protein